MLTPPFNTTIRSILIIIAGVLLFAGFVSCKYHIEGKIREAVPYKVSCGPVYHPPVKDIKIVNV